MLNNYLNQYALGVSYNTIKRSTYHVAFINGDNVNYFGSGYVNPDSIIYIKQ